MSQQQFLLHIETHFSHESMKLKKTHLDKYLLYTHLFGNSKCETTSGLQTKCDPWVCLAYLPPQTESASKF